MKKIMIQSAISFAIFATVVHLVISYYYLEINPTKWDAASRSKEISVTILLWVIFTYIISCIHSFNKIDKEK